ncbi:hypothetical protein AALA83_03200 [Oscillospiraceae bacterium 44-5]
MSRFLNVLICPHQRRKHVQAELERLKPGVVYLGELDMSRLEVPEMEWAERREGVFVRWRRSILDTSVPRILSGRLNCAVLLAYVRDDAMWGYVLCYKGSLTDQFQTVPDGLQDGFGDNASPEQRAARLAQYFPAGREDIVGYLTPWTEAERAGGGLPAHPGDRHPRGDCWQLEDFLNNLVPWAYDMLTSRQLAPTKTAPVPDASSPKENAPDREGGQRPPEREPGPETCLPFLTGVKALRRAPSRPWVYGLFPQKRPAPETIPWEGWTVRELEGTLDRFCGGELDRLELHFVLRGEGAYVRRLRKTVYQTFPFTLALLREQDRCMCMAFDGQESAVYRLIADVRSYMEVDTKLLAKTVFCGQTVEEYVVFQEPCAGIIRREVLFLLSRIDHRDDVLSAIRRNGVWSCEGNLANTDAARRRHEEIRALWCME